MNRHLYFTMMSLNEMDCIDTIIELLSHETICQRIDDPIDRSLVTFQYDGTEKMTHDRFNRIIKAYVNHLNETVLRINVNLNAHKILEEAIWILEQTYQSDHATGYDAALLDAVDPKRGMAFVLERMKELFKTQEREKYIAWVFATHIDPSDWYMHVRIVKTLLERYGHTLPSTISQIPARQIARHYKDIFILYTSTQEMMQSLFV